MPSLASVLLFLFEVVYFLRISALLLWIFVLESKNLFGFNVRTPEISQLIKAQKTHLIPLFLSVAEIPAAVDREVESQILKSLFEMVEKNQNQEAYIGIGNFIEKHPNFSLNTWLLYLKADLIFKIFLARGQGDWNLVLEEYEQALKKSPNHPRAPAAFYQMAYVKNILSRPFDVEKTIQEAMERFPQNLLTPYFLLLNADRFIRDRDYEQGLAILDIILKDYPNHITAKEAAFRKAFSLVQSNQFRQAILLFQRIQASYPQDFNFSKKNEDPDYPDRLIDQFIFAEALYRAGSYEQASSAFQSLGNLFPHHENAAFSWIRYADTFFKRKRYQAAQQIYEHVISKYPTNSLAVAVARMRFVESLRETDRLRYEREVEKQLELAARQSMKLESEILAEAAWIQLANYLIGAGMTVKSKRVLEILREQFLSAPSANWVKQEYEKIIEKADREYAEAIQQEILGHYQMNDRLAALTTYLANESIKYTNVEALLRAGEAAIEMDLFDKAESILSRVVYLESNSLARQDALLKLIDIMIKKKDIRRAAERLRRFNFAYPVSALKFRYEKSWGDIYKDLNRPERAIRHYEESIRLAQLVPGGIISIRSIYLDLGEMYSKVKLPGKAVEAYSQLIQLYRDKEKFKMESIPKTKRDEHNLNLARYRIADIYFDTRDFAQAVAAYQSVSQVILVEPVRSHALYRMGECYLALEDRQSALEIFQKLADQKPTNFWTRAAEAYIKTVRMESEHGIRILN